ncbi:MAG: RNA polymerase factor sigma-32 [Desulfarculus sp.]|nr:RNA polymerase factor sigma-32 [Desulfarculus sp.]
MSKRSSKDFGASLDQGEALLDPEVLDPERSLEGDDHEEGEGLEEAGLDLEEGAELEAEESALDLADELAPSGQPHPPAPVDALQRYLWEVRQYPLLSREEEEVLARRYAENGDPEAAAKLVTSNLRLVIKIAMEHQRYWMRNLLDLVQEGNTGLLQAVKKFDPFRGIKFSYYASFWIKAYILKFIMDNWRLVRLGTTQAQRKLFYNLRREKEKLRALGISPGARLLSDRLGVSEQEVVDMEQRLDSWELSLDAPVREESDDAHQSFMPDDKPAADELLSGNQLRRLFHDQLMAFRQTLDDKERDILDRRLLSEEPITLSELGAAHNISRERIRQIQERLLGKLHRYLREHIQDFDEQFADLTSSD